MQVKQQHTTIKDQAAAMFPERLREPPVPRGPLIDDFPCSGGMTGGT
jgi:hypothetical protein